MALRCKVLRRPAPPASSCAAPRGAPDRMEATLVGAAAWGARTTGNGHGIADVLVAHGDLGRHGDGASLVRNRRRDRHGLGRS